MFSTIFYRKDKKQDEIYYYNDENAAKSHMELFRADDSNLYSRIAVVNDDTNTTFHLMVFDESGKMDALYSQGTLVRLAPKYRSEGEAKYVFAISNINDKTMRLNITCLNSRLTLKPSEVVGVEMVEPIGEEITVEQIAKEFSV